MKTSLLLPLLFFIAGPIAAQNQNDDDPPYKTETFTGNVSNLKVDVSGGSIRVEGGDRKDVKVEMYVRLNNWPANKLDKAEIEKRLDDYEVVMKTEGNTVVLSSRMKEGRRWDNNRNINIGFKVFTPMSFATNLRTSGGSIHLTHLTGIQNFQTSGGSLHVTDVAGTIDGRTSGGSIHLQNCKQDIRLQTSGGSIHAEELDGTIDLKTSGGSVNLDRLKGKIAAVTSGGSVKASDISGEFVTRSSGGSLHLQRIEASLEAETSGGSLDVEITKLVGHVKLRASSGNIRLDIPEKAGADLDIRGNRVKIPLSQFRGETDDNRAVGKLNGGGVPVTVSASGNVTVY
ncbi:DUF4097 family beta strand repeat-containing protein [Siphonobacter aquaeclarae]|uniref:Putative adhesin n=1 Tax=Siphonobacter aquaeclarae TaxID=563176 RepID=A0A1G9LIJ9_9BACT|nr:DUF4097 family beta strand repeat-containing protein [Siphonobacter aquaeclarae]SDL61707.1 Putative adhesin [Siphonobacter aquaeclarae]